MKLVFFYNGFLGIMELVPYIFQKILQEGCLSEITHVVTSTSKIMMSLFDLACQFASDAYTKAHAIDFL